MSAGQ